MANVGIRGYAYCLNHAPELGYHYGITPYVERETKGETDYMKELTSMMPVVSVLWPISRVSSPMLSSSRP